MTKIIEMKGPLVEATHIPEPAARRLTAAAGAVAGLGIILSVVAALVDMHRFAFAYLVGFSYAVTLGLGALFFVLVVHVTKAGWSVVARRQMEFVAGALPVCILLFIPVALMAPTIYWEWWPGAAALNDPILAKKEVWLSHGFFFIRSAFYLVVWSALAMWFTRTSYEQDVSGDPRLTIRMQSASAPMLLVFALTLSFASFDWIMSLQPHWYSTIFGVYIFSGSFVTACAFLGLVTVATHRYGWFKRISNVEHRHDIGKLMFAFTVFWAYIAFSQFMLIWYANLPEETIFFDMRWQNGWRPWSLLLIFVCFVIPFLYLLPRTIKRIPATLTLGAVILLVAHYVDLYWLIMPMSDHHHHFNYSWIDIAGFLGPFGVFMFVAARRAARGPLYPLKDPYLIETVKVENL
jgi:hypothetical protein